MIKYFCDLCYREIKGRRAHYALTRSGALGVCDSLSSYDKEICEDCYVAIRNTVESIRKEEK